MCADDGRGWLNRSKCCDWLCCRYGRCQLCSNDCRRRLCADYGGSWLCCRYSRCLLCTDNCAGRLSRYEGGNDRARLSCDNCLIDGTRRPDGGFCEVDSACWPDRGLGEVESASWLYRGLCNISHSCFGLSWQCDGIRARDGGCRLHRGLNARESLLGQSGHNGGVKVGSGKCLGQRRGGCWQSHRIRADDGRRRESLRFSPSRQSHWIRAGDGRRWLGGRLYSRKSRLGQCGRFGADESRYLDRKKSGLIC